MPAAPLECGTGYTQGERGTLCVGGGDTKACVCVACGNSGSLPVVLVSTREEGQSHVAGRREAGDKEQNRMVRRWNCC